MSRLEALSVQFRECSIVRNDYDNNDQYTVSHSDALSNGDALGKGEMNGSVGNACDVKMRSTLKAKGKGPYKGGQEYTAATA